eukprot:3703370-Rhodomonas_salina.1
MATTIQNGEGGRGLKRLQGPSACRSPIVCGKRKKKEKKREKKAWVPRPYAFQRCTPRKAPLQPAAPCSIQPKSDQDQYEFSQNLSKASPHFGCCSPCTSIHYASTGPCVQPYAMPVPGRA